MDLSAPNVKFFGVNFLGMWPEELYTDNVDDTNDDHNANDDGQCMIVWALWLLINQMSQKLHARRNRVCFHYFRVNVTVR